MGKKAYKIIGFKRELVTLVLTGLLVFLAGCAGRIGAGDLSSGGSQSSQQGGPPSPTPPPSNFPPPPQTLKSCSTLSFTGVSFPSNFTNDDQEAFKIALNISGSYEGATGWANLANNFDGQGLSMGLLNQNLGQGTLQPLWISMHSQYLSSMQSVVSSTDLASMTSMLTAWQGTSKLSSLNLATEAFTRSIIRAQQRRLSIHDNINGAITGDPNINLISAETASPDATSVQWAVSNLYTSSGSFITTWSNELTAMAENPNYVTLQVAAGVSIHINALSDQNKSGVDELRSYLFMFDVEVQDGGFYSEDWSDYATYLAANTQATDTEKLTELLNLRLRHVQSAYVADVQSRKLAIINSTGTVHGTARNLPQQYCYSSTYAY